MSLTETIVIYASRRKRAALARQGIEIISEYQDYVLAEATEEQVARLRAEGFEVEVYQTAAPKALAFASAACAEAAAQPPSYYGPGEHHYLVQFAGPVKPEWLASIVDHGGRPLEPQPPTGYIVALDDTAWQWITAGPRYIASVAHYDADMRLSPDIPGAVESTDPLLARGEIRCNDEQQAAAPAVERVPGVFSVRFFEPADVVQALPQIRALGGLPSEPTTDSTVITVSFDSDVSDLAARLDQLARLHGIRSVEPASLRQLRNDVAIRLLGAKEVLPPSGLGLSGRGEIVAVADSGLDTGNPAAIHPDFAGRIAAIYSWPVAADWAQIVTNVGADDGPADTRSGHGTHVSGSVCGDGTASRTVQSDPVCGMAFEARLVFQAIEQSLKWTDAYRQSYYRQYRRFPPESGLAGLPADLKQVFQQAYDTGARLHNNSWGGGDFGAYDDYSVAVDQFMWQHKDFSILIAAGNDGADGNRDGVVDDGSITPPGTAKNCITVAAAESLREQGGYQLTYGQLWPADFSSAPLRNDRPSDSADDVAAFSSRGPTRDGRIKPDLVAPGTNILSVRSQGLPAGQITGWGAWSKLSDKYMFDGGTSMATPLMTGAAAVVRQYLRTVKRRANPSAALIKATLIHGSAYRAYRYGVAGGNGFYDTAQGWGHLDLRGVLAPDAPVQVRFYDNRSGLSTGQSWRWSCDVADVAVPLAFTLVWTDYPGSAGSYPNLVNDLDLVIISPSGAMFYGNNRLGQVGGRADRLNNIERIIVSAPERGRYTVRVRAFNVLRGPQDFALVYSGGIR